MSVTLYHNPRCSKSRQTLQLLQDNGVSPSVVLYLQSPPDVATLKSLVEQLGFKSARDLMRTKEAAYKEQGLKDIEDETALLQAMSDTPALIERPIVLANGKARLGRPPEQVLDII